ncbi:MBOAT family O-acyltransferase [Flavobacterium chungnamense]
MLFNSFHFIYFILFLFPLYWIIPQRFRWILMLVASYYFYMSWNYNYLVLILFTTLISFFAAIQIENTSEKYIQKRYLYGSILSSLSVLFFFKYYNFFSINLNSTLLSKSSQFPLIEWLLPVGISFYTFETLSYTIDVYHHKLKAERNIGIYALFIAFFPKLVAGPIERSENLLPQFRKVQQFKATNFIQGSKYIILGFFMKLVIADRLSLYVDSVYNNVNSHHGLTMWLATFCFSFQILCDFAGYSTIAKGIAKWFDFDLMLNFNRPYMALSFTDFWKRWHISLSSWFRDYVYIPLGGNKVRVSRRYLNLLITFVISGLWHGANWTFLLWGGLHGLYLIIENLLKNKKKKSLLEKHLSLRILKRMFIFIAVSFAWIFFRSNSVSDAIIILKKAVQIDNNVFLDPKTLFYGFIAISILVVLDVFAERKGNDNFLQNEKCSFGIITLFVALVLAIFYMGVFDGGQFIYFQF